jgi:hypothetical protein
MPNRPLTDDEIKERQSIIQRVKDEIHTREQYILSLENEIQTGTWISTDEFWTKFRGKNDKP